MPIQTDAKPAGPLPTGAKPLAYQVFMVEDYVLRYDTRNQRPWITVEYREGTQWRNMSFYPPKEDAVYIADLLRNEKPVYWVPDGGWLTTSAEPVGEEE